MRIFKMDKKELLLGTLLCSTLLLGATTADAATSSIKKESKKVTVTANNAKLYKDSTLKAHVKPKKGTVYQVNGYRIINGKHYYRVYQANNKNKQKYKGYIVSKNVKTLVAQNMTSNIVTKKSATLWNNFYWNNKKSVNKEETVMQTKYEYTLGNGEKYYSVYTKNNKGQNVWAGYTNKKNTYKLTSKNIKDKYVTLKKDYGTWKNLYFKQHQSSFKKGDNFKAKLYYSLNGKKFYSLYRTNSKNKEQWCGYANEYVIKDLKATNIPQSQQDMIIKNNCTTYKDHFYNKKGKLKKDEQVIAKKSYQYNNGYSYLSVYKKDSHGKEEWLGYVNKNNVLTLEQYSKNLIKQYNDRMNGTIAYKNDESLSDNVTRLKTALKNHDNNDVKKYSNLVANQLKDKKAVFNLNDWYYSEDKNRILLCQDKRTSGVITEYNIFDYVFPGYLKGKQIVMADNCGFAAENIKFMKRNEHKVQMQSSLAIQSMARSIFSESVIDVHNIDISNLRSLEAAFDDVTYNKITGLDSWNTKNVTNMSSLFRYKAQLDINELKNWDTSNVTDMSNMFNGCSITNVDALKNWNTSKVTNMESMFYRSNITNVDGLKNWNVSNVTNIGTSNEDSYYKSGIFANCEKLKNIDGLKNWNLSKVKDMSGMFYNCRSLTSIEGIRDWDMSNVTNIDRMFADNVSLSDISPILNKKWNSSVEGVCSIFNGCNNIPKNQIDQFKKDVDDNK